VITLHAHSAGVVKQASLQHSSVGTDIASCDEFEPSVLSNCLDQ
jgi:hypothetical protein